MKRWSSPFSGMMAWASVMVTTLACGGHGGLTGTAAIAAESADSAAPAAETREHRDARMKWWREARFGMFIHWGIYSVPAGTYQDKRIPALGEWIMFTARIPVADYAGFAKGFTASKFDAEAIVRLAKEAGMKYIVITAKHHDGFAMYGTKVSPFNVVDASPYKHDPLKDLAAACRKHDIKLGFYYSQCLDWHHPGGGSMGPKWDKAQGGDIDKYVDDVAVPQVRELLSNYGPVSVLWWDVPADMTPQRAAKLASLLKLQPGIITNDRLGGGFGGDTGTPEQRIPARGAEQRDWETCMTMNDTWGYRSDDSNWKSTQKLLHNLIDIASKGGNYLLNIGPTREGEVPQPSVERLQQIGTWLKTNGQSIYGTQASPFQPVNAAMRCTMRREGDDTILYVHLFEWPADGKALVPVRNTVVSASLLADPSRSFTAVAGDGGQTLMLSGAAPDKIASVIQVRLKGQPDVINAH